jgi:hypothetical protein
MKSLLVPTIAISLHKCVLMVICSLVLKLKDQFHKGKPIKLSTRHFKGLNTLLNRQLFIGTLKSQMFYSIKVLPKLLILVLQSVRGKSINYLVIDLRISTSEAQSI